MTLRILSVAFATLPALLAIGSSRIHYIVNGKVGGLVSFVATTSSGQPAPSPYSPTDL